MTDHQKESLNKLFQLGLLAEMAEKLEEEKKKKKRRRIWIREWIGRREPEIPLFMEIQNEDHEKFYSDFRLYPNDFEQLLQR